MVKEFKVYVLVNVNTPIYVGMSGNMEKRLKEHKLTGKAFTRHVIVDQFADKQKALDAERAITKYLSLFGNPENVNGKYVNMELSELYKKIDVILRMDEK